MPDDRLVSRDGRQMKYFFKMKVISRPMGYPLQTLNINQNKNRKSVTFISEAKEQGKS